MVVEVHGVGRTVPVAGAAGGAVGQRGMGGVYGHEAPLPNLDKGDWRLTAAFRAGYATLLEQLIGVEAKASLGKSFVAVPFL